MPNEAEIYADYMTGVRMRLDEVSRILAATDMPEFSQQEASFLQLRKALELIAFASLAANRDAYAAAFPTFAEDWKAKRILEKIEKINPEFYPMALEAPQEIAPGRKHFLRPGSGFMTKDDFVALYQIASEVLHTRNPFTRKAPIIDIKYTVPEWVARIQRLLTWHQVRLVSGTLWIVRIPDKGNVDLWPAAPLDGSSVTK
jgi:hypothetical protein